ncbi:uncharacterized protein PpBr36_05768 [Pyricularia pennisetigena]|uniref:uncharacterized protein n=1 Tax=Pyricularia pennisetigena TaxID=1578925 RepID=UPI0011505E01|nr:uncharacterized protein PpBr36_05768 [Pyricularia pennisetigena]TLS23309.1 hypothetical protein PpBr36_05768 [Pyricularia pennisetigena]
MDGYPESDECAIDSDSDSENESLTQNLPFERIFQKTSVSSSRTSKSFLTVGLENETHPAKRQTKNHHSSLYKCSSYEPTKKVDIEGSNSKVLNNQPKGALVAETVLKKNSTELREGVQKGKSNESSKNSWPASTTSRREKMSGNGRQNVRYLEQDALGKKSDDWDQFDTHDYHSQFERSSKHKRF